MIFNIVIIAGIVLQGCIITWLVNRLYAIGGMVTAVFAYFQRMAQDFGYPEIAPMKDWARELDAWSEAKKKTNGETQHGEA